MAESPHAHHWDLDPDVVFLNHGSFGATPRVVLEEQQRLRQEMESEPVAFLWREGEERLDAARAPLAELLNAEPEGLVFVHNATIGINTALAAIDLAAGDEVLFLDPEYNATANAIRHACERAGARASVVSIPFPIADPEVVVERVLGALTPATRFLVIDHIVSQTALIFPIEKLIGQLRERGVETIVDGAHGPGQLPLDLEALGAAYYTGNCHKWLCTPKGAAFLYIREDFRERTRPLVISHGANSPRTDRSRLLIEQDWIGTLDPTAWLCIPKAIEFLSSIHPGGLAELRRRNRELALRARTILCEALEIDVPAPASMVGSMASVPLPRGTGELTPPLYIDPLQDALWHCDRIEVPIQAWPAWPERVLRVSAQAYNHEDQYFLLGERLRERLGDSSGAWRNESG